MPARHSKRSTVIMLIVGLLLIATATGLLIHHFKAQPASSETVATDHGTKTAPEPEHTFTNDGCPDKDTEPDQHLDKDQWSTPDIGQSATFHTDSHGTNPVLPDAPDGIRYGPSMPVGSKQGATVLAGHVDYAPGELSQTGGELSPWGHLHQAKECSPITISDDQGNPHSYVITDISTADQESLPANELFRSTGDPAVYLITCSGPSTQDAGGTFQFNYKYNLIVKAQPVS